MQPIILETTKFDKQPGYMGLFSLEPATLIQFCIIKIFQEGSWNPLESAFRISGMKFLAILSPICYFLIASFSTLYTHPLLSAKNNLSDTWWEL